MTRSARSRRDPRRLARGGPTDLPEPDPARDRRRRPNHEPAAARRCGCRGGSTIDDVPSSPRGRGRRRRRRSAARLSVRRPAVRRRSAVRRRRAVTDADATGRRHRRHGVCDAEPLDTAGWTPLRIDSLRVQHRRTRRLGPRRSLDRAWAFAGSTADRLPPAHRTSFERSAWTSAHRPWPAAASRPATSWTRGSGLLPGLARSSLRPLARPYGRRRPSTATPAGSCSARRHEAFVLVGDRCTSSRAGDRVRPTAALRARQSTRRRRISRRCDCYRRAGQLERPRPPTSADATRSVRERLRPALAELAGLAGGVLGRQPRVRVAVVLERRPPAS